MVVAEKLYATGLETSCGTTCSASGYRNCCEGACGIVRTTAGGAAGGGVCSPYVPMTVPDRAGGYDGYYCQGCPERRDGYQSPAFVVFVVFPAVISVVCVVVVGSFPVVVGSLNQAAIPVPSACRPEWRRTFCWAILFASRFG